MQQDLQGQGKWLNRIHGKILKGSGLIQISSKIGCVLAGTPLTPTR